MCKRTIPHRKGFFNSPPFFLNCNVLSSCQQPPLRLLRVEKYRNNMRPGILFKFCIHFFFISFQPLPQKLNKTIFRFIFFFNLNYLFIYPPGGGVNGNVKKKIHPTSPVCFFFFFFFLKDPNLWRVSCWQTMCDTEL